MLTDLNVRGAKPKSKNYKLFDQRGLFLLITPTGCRYWRLRFQIENVQREMALGQYPEMTLAQARLAQANLRSKIKVGVDPLKEREEEVLAAKAAERLKNDTFGKAVEDYFESKQAHWSATHRRDVERIFSKELLPSLGSMPIALITKRDLKEIVDRIVSRNALTFVRDVIGYFGIVVRHYNSYSDDLVVDHSISIRSYLPVQTKQKHHNALPAAQLGEFMNRLRLAVAGSQIRIGLELLLSG